LTDVPPDEPDEPDEPGEDGGEGEVEVPCVAALVITPVARDLAEV